MASQPGLFNFQAFTNLGDLGDGMRLYTYAPSTTTHKIAYTDAAGAVPHTYTNDGSGGQYIALDARGELPAPLFLSSGGYDITLKTAAGATVWTRRAIGQNDGAATLDAALRADLLDYTSTSKGVGMVGSDPSLAYPDRTIGQRIHRDYINVGDIGGTDPTGTVDNTAKVLAAIATGKLVRLDGFYRISTTLTNPLVGIVGDGPRKSGLIVNGVDAITFASNAGLDRRAARLEGFAIDSLSNSCDGKYAIYAPGVAAAATVVYNSGLNVSGIEIGRNGRMGGGLYLKDFFRVNVSDVGMTDVSSMIRIVGSVVQGKFQRITSNNDSAAATLNKYGISTETATYDTGSLSPENLRFIDVAYIRGDRGVNHTAGLDVEFENFDTEADFYGALLNAPCNMDGGVIAPGPNAASWVGISRGVSPSNPDDGTLISRVDVNLLRQPSSAATSYGIDLGDGASPVYGVTVKECRIRGVANSVAQAIRGRDLRDATVIDNFVRSTIAVGTEVSLTGRRIWCERNRVPSGEIQVSDGGETTAYGSIKQNQCSTVTLSLTKPSQWEIGNNENLNSRFVRGVITGSATFDPANLAAGASTNTNVTVTGAVVGDVAMANITTSTTANVIVSAFVSAANTVRVVFTNHDSAPVDLASGTVYAVVMQTQ